MDPRKRTTVKVDLYEGKNSQDGKTAIVAAMEFVGHSRNITLTENNTSITLIEYTFRF